MKFPSILIIFILIFSISNQNKLDEIIGVTIILWLFVIIPISVSIFIESWLYKTKKDAKWNIKTYG